MFVKVGAGVFVGGNVGNAVGIAEGVGVGVKVGMVVGVAEGAGVGGGNSSNAGLIVWVPLLTFAMTIVV